MTTTCTVSEKNWALRECGGNWDNLCHLWFLSGQQGGLQHTQEPWCLLENQTRVGSNQFFLYALVASLVVQKEKEILFEITTSTNNFSWNAFHPSEWWLKRLFKWNKKYLGYFLSMSYMLRLCDSNASYGRAWDATFWDKKRQRSFFLSENAWRWNINWNWATFAVCCCMSFFVNIAVIELSQKCWELKQLISFVKFNANEILNSSSWI